jgi:hypothetical protein
MAGQPSAAVICIAALPCRDFSGLFDSKRPRQNFLGKTRFQPPTQKVWNQTVPKTFSPRFDPAGKIHRENRKFCNRQCL